MYAGGQEKARQDRYDGWGGGVRLWEDGTRSRRSDQVCDGVGSAAAAATES